MTQEEFWQSGGGLHAPSSSSRLSGQSPRAAVHHHHHGSPRHPRLNVVYVDTIITDSNGNTSRYDSQEDVHASPSHGHQQGRRHSGPSLKVFSTAPHLRGTHSESGLCDSFFADKGGVLNNNNNNNNNHHHDNRVRVKGGGGGDGGGRAGGKLSPQAKSAPSSKPSSRPSSRPSSPRPEGSKKYQRRHSTATASHSNNSLMSHDGVLLNVPTFALTADPLLAAPNAHHTRASSFREHKTSAKNELQVDEVALGNIRRNSMPNVCNNNLLNVPGSSPSGSSGELTDKDARGIRRVRSFKTTSKGVIVNRGDSFKKKSTHSLMSTGSTVTDNEVRARASSHNGQSNFGAGGVGAGAPAYFRVYMMGAAGVGKTSMAHQFLTSEYVDHDDADETPQMTVTVLVDGEESTIEFIDPPDRNVITEGLEQLLDAFVVVYAINDHDSFDTAHQLVRYLRLDYGTDRAILLVANKIDLVRKRKVTADEARLLATTFDCKYAETSAALNHHVDELLVGIVTQIRLQLSIPFTSIMFPHKDSKRHKGKKALCKGPKGFFARLFRRGSSRSSKKDRGVEDLMY